MTGVIRKGEGSTPYFKAYFKGNVIFVRETSPILAKIGLVCGYFIVLNIASADVANQPT